MGLPEWNNYRSDHREQRKRKRVPEWLVNYLLSVAALGASFVGYQWINANYDIQISITQKQPEIPQRAISNTSQNTRQKPVLVEQTRVVPQAPVNNPQKFVAPTTNQPPPRQSESEMHQAYLKLKEREERCRQARNYSVHDNPRWVRQQLDMYCRW